MNELINYLMDEQTRILQPLLLNSVRRSFFNTKGFSVGTPEYKKCVMNKGRKN